MAVMMGMVMPTMFVVNMIVFFMMMVMNLSAMPNFVVRVVAAGVGTRLGLEGRLDVGDVRAQLADHLLEDVVVRDPQKLLVHLHRHVAVSEVVRDSCKFF